MNEKTITKEISHESYEIREKGRWLATIIISKTGMLNVQSDYGDYCYHWTSLGDMTFKQFLISIDKTYLISKIGRETPKEFDLESSVKNVKKDIIEKLKYEEISSKCARFFWDELIKLTSINEYEFQVDLDNIMFYDELAPQSLFEKIYGGYIENIYFVKKTSFQLTTFVDEIWPVFVNEIKKEIEIDAIKNSREEPNDFEDK